MAHVLVTGATGYIGSRLVPELLEAGHRVRCLARTPSKLDETPWRGGVEVAKGDVTDPDSLQSAFDGIDTAYFLVHSMGGSDHFAEDDKKAAATFRDAAADAGVGRIVYLGGLGRDDDPSLSPHLRSRHEVGRTLADGKVPVTELRAAIILGSGSASFEMLRYLVEVLPAMTTPKWVENRCQPIAIRDVLAWLVGALELGLDEHQVVEIGGPDVLTYREMMQGYASAAGLRRRLIVGVPVLSPRLSSLWVGLVTPLPSGLARPLVESLVNEVVVRHPSDPPFDHGVLSFADAVDAALRHSGDAQVASSGRETEVADPHPSDPDWAGGTLLVHRHEAPTTAAPEEVFATVESGGGHGGWSTASRAWKVLGALGRSPVPHDSGRTDASTGAVPVGDRLDSWPIDAREPSSLLRLRSGAYGPGDAWLEWRIEPDASGGSRVTQRALFYPRGLGGRVYWYARYFADRALLARLVHDITAAAEARPGSGGAAAAPSAGIR
ncbi:MAG: DUF2867 domain-containing protein [Acidimicrobiales bacterium]